MLQDITQAELEGAEVTIDRPAGASREKFSRRRLTGLPACSSLSVDPRP